MSDPVTATSECKAQVLVGLVGKGILASGSPWLHEQEGAAQGLQLRYELFDFTARNLPDDALGTVLKEAAQGGFAGLNVTYPFKQAVIPLLDELDASASKVGAVNTVAFTPRGWIGSNTDMTGFAASFLSGLGDVDRASALQVGCGGAGAATAHAMLSLIGVGKLWLHDADPQRAERLLGQLAAVYGADRVALTQDPVATAQTVAGLVNATPMGMAKFPGMPLPAAAIEQRHWVADIVYFPLETEFLRTARAKGCRVLDGSGMAVHQAAEAFEIFTQQRADRQRMLASFTDFTRTAAKLTI